MIWEDGEVRPGIHLGSSVQRPGQSRAMGHRRGHQSQVTDHVARGAFEFRDFEVTKPSWDKSIRNERAFNALHAGAPGRPL